MLTGSGNSDRGQPPDPFDQVIDVAERAGLAPVAVDRQRFAFERLGNEIGHHAAVAQAHARAEGIEDPDDAGGASRASGGRPW